MPFTVTEPHPTVVANTYTHSGRGGLGNTFRAPVTTPATGVPTLAKIPSASSTVSTRTAAARFYAGRGGAGNAHPAEERRSLSLDDEYRYAAAVAKTTTSGHVGRGGAGNVFRTTSSTSSSNSAGHSHHFFKSSSNRKGSDASASSSGSGSSADEPARRSGFFARFR